MLESFLKHSFEFCFVLYEYRAFTIWAHSFLWHFVDSQFSLVAFTSLPDRGRIFPPRCCRNSILSPTQFDLLLIHAIGAGAAVANLNPQTHCVRLSAQSICLLLLWSHCLRSARAWLIYPSSSLILDICRFDISGLVFNRWGFALFVEECGLRVDK